jgi:hypothetical protein
MRTTRRIRGRRRRKRRMSATLVSRNALARGCFRFSHDFSSRSRRCPAETETLQHSDHRKCVYRCRRPLARPGQGNQYRFPRVALATRGLHPWLPAYSLRDEAMGVETSDGQAWSSALDPCPRRVREFVATSGVSRAAARGMLGHDSVSIEQAPCSGARSSLGPGMSPG